jgi:hypothetical protein
MYHALIRTHHITSRKKVARLKAAAKVYQCFALLRSGGMPGVMYARAKEKAQVQSWVDTVHDLRYKDYQLVAPVDAVRANETVEKDMNAKLGSLEETETVKDMAAQMDSMGLLKWWRVAMGFQREE